MKPHHLHRVTPLAIAAVFVLCACAGQQAISKPLHEEVKLDENVKLVSMTETPMPVMRPMPLPDRIPNVKGAENPVQERADVVRMGHLSCVPFARMWSGIKLAGNAYTWWAHAKGHYERSSDPEIGAVMVFSRTRHLRSGHVAVVRRVINSREIRVDHANWGNGGKIYLNARIIDVSAKNDWSRVRVWNTPLNTMGSRVYSISGFILPHDTEANS